MNWYEEATRHQDELRHEAAGIDLRTEPRLLAFWDRVIGSTLGFSGIRLRNARMIA